MKTKPLLYFAFLLLLVLPSGINAQISSYDLSKYIVPDIALHRLTTRVNFNQSSSLEGKDGAGQYETDVANVGASVRLSYDGFVINRKWQNSYNLSTNNFLSFNNTQSGTLEDRSFSWQNSISAFNTIRKYKEEDIFYEWTTALTTTLQGSNIRSSSFNRKRSIRDFSLIMPFRAGTGRIENVSFAQQAVFLLRKLKEIGKIKKTISHEEITAFADAIAKIRSRRVFDFRLRRIFELEQLDKFLMDNQIIDEQDISYFAHLNDQWVYGSLITRGSGYRFSFAVHPGIIYNDQNLNNLDETDGHFYSLLIGFEFLHTHPINPFWQRSFELNAYAGFTKGNVFDDFTNVNKNFSEPKTLVNAIISAGYFPDTRTSINMNLGTSVNVSLSETNNFTTEVLGLDGSVFQTYLDLDFVYFMLPRLRLNINTGFRYIGLIGAEQQAIPSFSGQMLTFLQYPNCSNFACVNIYGSSRSFRQSFNITLNYDLF